MRRFDSSTTKYAPAHRAGPNGNAALRPRLRATTKPMITPIKPPKNSAMTPRVRGLRQAAREPAREEAKHQAELHVTEAHPTRRDQMEDEEDAEDRGRADERPRNCLRDVLLERHEHDDGHRDRERRKHQAVRDPVVLEIDRRDRDEEGTEEQIGDRDHGVVEVDRHRDEHGGGHELDDELAPTWAVVARGAGLHRAEDRNPPGAAASLPAPRARRRQVQREAVLGNLDRDPLDEHVQDRADDEARKRAQTTAAITGKGYRRGCAGAGMGRVLSA